jgi:hypothetical protein
MIRIGDRVRLRPESETTFAISQMTESEGYVVTTQIEPPYHQITTATLQFDGVRLRRVPVSDFQRA